MSAVSRMLGRWRSGGCGCKTPGPDCAGHGRDTRRRKRQELRAVDREIRDALADRQASAYGYDSPRRRFDRDVRREMREIVRKRSEFTLRQKALARTVMVATIWAIGAVVLQMLAPAGNRLDFPIPPAPAAVSTR